VRISFFTSRGAWAFLSLTLLVGLAAHTARAEGPAANKIEEHEKRIKELEQQLHDLNLGQAQVNAAIENQKAAKPTTGWIDGFTVGSSDGRFKLKIGAYTQADGRRRRLRQGLRQPHGVGKQGGGMGHWRQLVPEQEHQAGAQLRTDRLQGRRRHHSQGREPQDRASRGHARPAGFLKTRHRASLR